VKFPLETDDGALPQGLLDRPRQGDREARRLLERACERLRRLAGRMLHGSFADLARRHEVDSAVHEAWSGCCRQCMQQVGGNRNPL
jgi:hypothetical protein